MWSHIETVGNIVPWTLLQGVIEHSGKRIVSISLSLSLSLLHGMIAQNILDQNSNTKVICLEINNLLQTLCIVGSTYIATRASRIELWNQQ